MQSYISGIRSALHNEIAATPEYALFLVESVKIESGIWRLVLQPKNGSSRLDESMEGNKVWWLNSEKGSATVLSVLPEESEVHLRFLIGSKPTKGDQIRIYITNFLAKLYDYWKNDINSRESIAWLTLVQNNNNFTKENALTYTSFPSLRDKQKEAFKLPGWRLSFLWGPPGTGKTYTLGAMLAQFLVQFPKKRILLLSSTNNAVDFALTSVDESLDFLAKSKPEADIARSSCKRLGNNFIATHYKNRQHLLPVRDERILNRLHELELSEPDKRDIAQYRKWKDEIDKIRELIRQEAQDVLSKTRLAALTTTRAIYTLDDLKIFEYDLLVFDEASQVSVAHALALAHLGKSCIFAGDFSQLSPVALSKGDLAKTWLLNSMFKYKTTGQPSFVTLDEQSRMCSKICDMIRDVFYPTVSLRVAADIQTSSSWAKERLPRLSDRIFSNPLTILTINSSSTWSTKYGGNIRYESALQCVDVAKKYISANAAEDLLILTPFRAQKNLIRAILRNEKCKGISVSTVHRAQGGERHTILFDPVDAAGKFLVEASNPDAKRLLNVALSRAKASIIIPLSRNDQENPLYKQIYNIVINSDRIHDYKDLEYYVDQPNFPLNSIKKVVSYAGCIGRVLGVNNDTGKPMLSIEDYKTGNVKNFLLQVILDKFNEVKQPRNSNTSCESVHGTELSLNQKKTTSSTSDVDSEAVKRSELDSLDCPICSVKFFLNNMLQEHIRSEHSSVLEETVDCVTCGVSLKLKNYAKHQRIKHDVNSIVPNVKIKKIIRRKKLGTKINANKATDKEKEMIADYIKRNPVQKKY